jgi:deoxyadenosine/deoxycytidine kinase
MYIAIAGNIGSGKTTLANLLSQHFGWSFHADDPDENPYLPDFYDNMRDWAFNLQMFFLAQRSRNILKGAKNNLTEIYDRTVYEDGCIFAPNLLGMGLISARDFDTCKALYDMMTSLLPPPALLIYLKASVPTLVNRIRKRGREYESNIRIDYLQSLNDRFDHWIDSYANPCFTVNIDELNFSENSDDLHTVTKTVSLIMNYEL